MTLRLVPFALVLTVNVRGRPAGVAVGIPLEWFEWLIPTVWLERTVQNL